MTEELVGKGKRGIVYKTKYRGKDAVIKVENPNSKAFERIENEARWLKILNRHSIGPKFYKLENGSLIREYAEGDLILDFFEKGSKKKIIDCLRDIFLQCRKMDRLKVNKMEMHKPIKHILVGKKPVMIDFERCHTTNKPKNVTQFSQFLISKQVKPMLLEKGLSFDTEEIIEANKGYKTNPNEKNFKAILEKFGLTS
ncbi:MAG: hypothetical protein V1906_00680 [Candidatus Woesearchaeota archaeon]